MSHISAFRQKGSILFKFLNLFMNGARLSLLYFCSFSFWGRNSVQDQSPRDTKRTPSDHALTYNEDQKLQNPARTKGFTLIEVIVVMLIMGILVVFMGAGTARIIEGYLFTRNNVETALKAQIAMSRIIKEFRSIETIKDGDQNAITYAYYDQNKKLISTPPGVKTLYWAGSDNDPLQLRGNILIDKVNKFELTYYDNYKNSPNSKTWNSKSKMIGITLNLNGASGQVSSFSTRIMPRSIK